MRANVSATHPHCGHRDGGDGKRWKRKARWQRRPPANKRPRQCRAGGHCTQQRASAVSELRGLAHFETLDPRHTSEARDKPAADSDGVDDADCPGCVSGRTEQRPQTASQLRGRHHDEEASERRVFSVHASRGCVHRTSADRTERRSRQAGKARGGGAHMGGFHGCECRRGASARLTHPRERATRPRPVRGGRSAGRAATGHAR